MLSEFTRMTVLMLVMFLNSCKLLTMRSDEVIAVNKQG
ncbi:hypothetical protein AM1_G0120 (plasmid) [Acaryochloris marina MBIC11017]|uniref:Uncharacterized protein n=1 Tax=Acaryochloris marina (strain MBIC 11017) TaxID=329726 RepID=A8ZQL4_ACAM1|nr:hypothetical protein AM1_G0120 [Acaryochloris marina MBIC11017]